MNAPFYIESYCSIKNNILSINGKWVLENTNAAFPEFIKEVYKTLDTQYPKFFKMDNLSKLAFLAADVLLKKEANEEEQNIAIVFSNKASSLDTDRMHQKTIEDPQNYYPSPALFVYTLPNICIGEICIKHKLYSENSFFIFNHFNEAYLHAYANSLLQNKKAPKVLCGWINYEENNYEAFVYLVSKQGSIQHTVEEINKLYTIL